MAYSRLKIVSQPEEYSFNGMKTRFNGKKTRKSQWQRIDDASEDRKSYLKTGIAIIDFSITIKPRRNFDMVYPVRWFWDNN